MLEPGGRGEGSRLRGPGQALEPVTVWPGGRDGKPFFCLGEMEILADSTWLV